MNILNVGELTKYIKFLFDQDRRLVSVFIKGEISNFKQHYSGHCYFTLKDNEAMIRAVMFRSRAQYLKFSPVNGLQVIAGGRVAVYERDGQYQLYVEQLMPQGVGELSLAYEQLKEKLEKEGVFDNSRKRTIPVFPRAVGVITSPTGAAVRDIFTVSRRRHPGIPLVLCPVQVQGEEAPAQIVHAIRMFNNARNVDVIILGRGGGSIEELWAFNDERVVRAISDSKIAIVSAVGHETDFTLADFAADLRAATPSQAAEMVTPDAKELSRHIINLLGSLEIAVASIIRKKQASLEQVLASRVFTRPCDFVLDRQQLLDSHTQKLIHAMHKGFAAKQQQFKIAAGKLAALNPLSVLARGYSIVHADKNVIIKKSQDVQIGQTLKVVLHEGEIGVRVIKIEERKIYGQD